jgi:hypothetical protein
MAKKDDIEDLLGTGTPAAKKTGKKAAEPAAAPAAKKGKKAEAEPAAAPAKKAAAKKAEPAEKPAKEPVHFAPGEREAMYEAIIARFKSAKAKPVNSKDLAAELAVSLPKANITTRKLRPVLYALAKREDAPIALELSASKVLGMTVSRA